MLTLRIVLVKFTSRISPNLNSRLHIQRVGNLYQYNTIGWLIEKRIPIKEREEIVYQLTKYEYDIEGNCICEKRYLDEQTQTSSCGRIHTISFKYDKVNRLIKVSDCTGAVVEYRYDCLNKRTYERHKINENTYQF